MTAPNQYLRQAHKLVPDVLAILVATVAIGITAYFGKLLVEAPKISLADGIQTLILIFIAGTMFVAIWSQRRNQAFGRSAAYLDKAIKLIGAAKEVLSTTGGAPTNDRISWVTAARLLTRAEAIAKQISEPPHRAIYEAEHDYQRHTFHDFLRINGDALEASFFCGAPRPGMTIGDAVHDPSQEDNGQNWIPPRVLAVIYRFFQYPEGYEDPLDASSALSSRELDRFWLFQQRGVCDYVTFRQNFVPVGREIRQRVPGAAPVRVSAADVTAKMELLSGQWEE